MPRGVARVGREEPPEIAEPGRTEQRVGHGMERDIAVGVAVEPRRPRDLDAAQGERRARSERMAVVPEPDAHGTGRRATAPTRRRSAGTRHLEVRRVRPGSHGRGWYRPRAGRLRP